MRVSSRHLGPIATVTAVLGLGLFVVAPPSVVHAAPPGASVYVAVTPYRILDSRTGQGFPQRKVNAGEAFTLALTNVPPGSSAVVLNMTITNSADRGFVTVYPTGVPRPTASSINVDAAGQTIANLATVPIGSGGSVDVFSQMQADLVADVQGYYVPATSAQAGRFIPVTPTRLLDTREPTSPHYGALAANESLSVNVAALAGLPADAAAAALKVTVTDSTGSGFWTVYPTGSTRPTASNLNVDGAGSTIANQVLAPLNGGQTTVYSQSGGNLVIDLVGWFTGSSSPASDVGLFVPVTPARLLDSRQPPLGAMPGPNRTAEVPVANRFNVPASGVGAVVVNATITDALGAGYFSHLAGADLPAAGIEPQRDVRRPDHRQPRDRPGEHGRLQLLHPVGGASDRRHRRLVHRHRTAHGPATQRAAHRGDRAAAHPAVHLLAGHLRRAIAMEPVPAHPLHVNLGGYDPSARAMINEAVERLQAATGLPLIPAGDTTFEPTSATPTPSGTASGDIVIALSDSAHTDLVPGSIVGRTDISYTSVIVKASVVVDMGDVGAAPRVVEHRRRPGVAPRTGARRRPRPCRRRNAAHERDRITGWTDHLRSRRSHRPVAGRRRPRMRRLAPESGSLVVRGHRGRERPKFAVFRSRRRPGCGTTRRSDRCEPAALRGCRPRRDGRRPSRR